MNATEEWLRYIENKHIMEEYNIKGYTKNEESEQESEEDTEK